MRRLCFLFVLIIALLPAIVLAHEEDPAGAIRIESGSEEQGDVSTVDQPIVVNGMVHGDVTSISGEIVVRGVVTGDVVTWGGDIRVEPGARIDGNVMAVAGMVHREGGPRIAGAVFNGNLEQAGFASLIPGVGVGSLSLSTRLGLLLGLFAIGVAIAALLSHIWNHAVESAALVIGHFPARTLALGLVTTLLAAVIFALLLLVLTFMLVGVLVVPALLVAVHLPFLAGVASAGRALEQWLGVERGTGIVGPALLLIPALALAPVSPLLALLAFLLVAAPGIGGLFLLRSAALRFHGA